MASIKELEKRLQNRRSEIAELKEERNRLLEKVAALEPVAAERLAFIERHRQAAGFVRAIPCTDGRNKCDRCNALALFEAE